MFKLIIFSIYFLLLCFSSYANEDSKKCIKFYDNGNYKKALSYCLKSSKDNEPRLGYIYSTLKKCSSSREWYIKGNTSVGYTNLGLAYRDGSNGCKKSLSNAKKYFNKALW